MRHGYEKSIYMTEKYNRLANKIEKKLKYETMTARCAERLVRKYNSAVTEITRWPVYTMKGEC